MPPKKSTSTSTETKTTRGSKKKPTLQELQHEIEKRAYEISIERRSRGLHGDELSDWLQAETEIKEKYGL
ncbi:DUF2934 domain-containing protein [Thermospira aquatica]|uniref:DUF2934 domain-containing protein n=1 Tax=Thermospira aquatica TaxID=2828656 RepID=A0AAX3BCJ0_9SPIR|nr:hypothetical protein [Thermospira aquatica]URA09997.1 hypothetical protein KDW03_11025 [Thermospira aquatica]